VRLCEYDVPVDDLAAEVEARLNRDRPLQEGDQWKATRFEPGWWSAVPVGDSPYAGGHYLVRHDGAEVAISSNPAIHGSDETRAVIREMGATASPEEITDEIRRRTELGSA